MPAGERHRGPSPAQHRRMHVLWRLAGVGARADRLLLTAAIVGRPLVTSSDLSEREAARVIRYMEALDHLGELESKAAEWLAAHRNEWGQENGESA